MQQPMLEQSITIINKLGLHARAAAKLVSTSSTYTSKIKISYNGKEVDAKSIMSVMMLAASKGSEVTLHVSGDDEKAAMQAITDLINNRFDEDE
ncbi:probable phosphocarrier protein hpr (phosphohistidinoprotein-hexose phosphotransferase) [Oceanobacter sp. RED65]|uniref:Probable phosphocarrier protein hpr (Phosphohistidinoprotein-hexose phosphotransferase) n=2 Tax=Bermanella marisrubri TaxID=207949 RepID=Q1MYM3_9GAMM|nr:probable phosphocarrier protein hpr (phosphohistidinoprotein-hexose phosphotransferase) [Oceanobacter sp. RED65] [Bermanella marisrubri]